MAADAFSSSIILVYTSSNMSSILNFVDANADTLQQMALLAYLKDPDMGEPLLQAITTYKVTL